MDIKKKITEAAEKLEGSYKNQDIFEIYMDRRLKNDKRRGMGFINRV